MIDDRGETGIVRDACNERDDDEMMTCLRLGVQVCVCGSRHRMHAASQKCHMHEKRLFENPTYYIFMPFSSFSVCPPWGSGR